MILGTTFDWLVVWNMNFIFHSIWDNPSHCLIFFKMVKTTNQLIFGSGKWSVGPLELQFSAGIWAVPEQTLSGNKSG